MGDIEWLRPDGALMDEDDWNSGFARSVMVFLNGDAIPEQDQMGRRVTDDHFLLLFNAHSEPIRFTLPPKSFGNDWRVRLDTATGAVDPAGEKPWRARSKHLIEAHSMVVLSTAVVPEAERAASEQRAQLAMGRAAKESAHDRLSRRQIPARQRRRRQETSVTQVPDLALNNGQTIPQLGFGVFQIDPAETAEAVGRALEVGYRHIDTAEMYRNEKGVGEGVRASGLDRGEVYVTSKLSNACPRAGRRAAGLRRHAGGARASTTSTCS